MGTRRIFKKTFRFKQKDMKKTNCMNQIEKNILLIINFLFLTILINGMLIQNLFVFNSFFLFLNFFLIIFFSLLLLRKNYFYFKFFSTNKEIKV